MNVVACHREAACARRRRRLHRCRKVRTRNRRNQVIPRASKQGAFLFVRRYMSPAVTEIQRRDTERQCARAVAPPADDQTQAHVVRAICAGVKSHTIKQHNIYKRVRVSMQRRTAACSSAPADVSSRTQCTRVRWRRRYTTTATSSITHTRDSDSPVRGKHSGEELDRILWLRNDTDTNSTHTTHTH
jgi:hypothetical protein